MLAIRLQRTGRKGHAMFRVIVQDARRSPTSGQVVAALGSYDPHTKTVTIVKDKAELYLKNGAHPSPRAARLLKQEGVKIPNWVITETKKSRTTRNPEKLRKNQPARPVAETPAEATNEAAVEIVDEETPTQDATTQQPAAAEGPVATETPAPEEPVAKAATDEADKPA